MTIQLNGHGSPEHPSHWLTRLLPEEHPVKCNNVWNKAAVQNCSAQGSIHSCSMCTFVCFVFLFGLIIMFAWLLSGCMLPPAWLIGKVRQGLHEIIAWSDMCCIRVELDVRTLDQRLDQKSTVISGDWSRMRLSSRIRLQKSAVPLACHSLRTRFLTRKQFAGFEVWGPI